MCGFFLVRGRRPDDDQGVQVRRATRFDSG